MEEKNELRILITDEDKFGHDISKMSNFFDGYINALSTQVKSASSLETINVQPSDMAIIGNALCQAGSMVSGKAAYVPDFDSLPTNIKAKLNNKVYTIGESRQVEGNLRPVILDENGVSVKDITLKKVVNATDTLGTVSNMLTQMQLRQINSKLDVILELQSYQIEVDRKERLESPFLNARDAVLRAQDSKTVDERIYYLREADEKLGAGRNAIYHDMEAIAENLAKSTRFPIFQNTPKRNKYISYLAHDLDLATKYVGFQLQVLGHLGRTDDAINVLESYQHDMDNFINKPVDNRNRSAIELMHDYCPRDVQNLDCWYNFANDMKPFLQAEIPTLDTVYLITVEEDDHDDENT